MVDEVTGEAGTAGEQLRTARESQGITLEDVAARTRIPTRHLQSLEDGEWDKLPAPTYTLGFAKSYASVVGLDRVAIGDTLRAEMGAGALAARPEAQVFEPADPARVMPRWLVILALLALVACRRGLPVEPQSRADPRPGGGRSRAAPPPPNDRCRRLLQRRLRPPPAMARW